MSIHVFLHDVYIVRILKPSPLTITKGRIPKRKIEQLPETERKRLVIVTQMVLQRIQEGDIALEDTIEELCPIRMRIYEIDCHS